MPTPTPVPKLNVSRVPPDEMGRYIQMARAYLQETEPPAERIQDLDALFPSWLILNKVTLQTLAGMGFSREEYQALRQKLAADQQATTRAKQSKAPLTRGPSPSAFRLAAVFLVYEVLVVLLRWLLLNTPLGWYILVINAPLAVGLLRFNRWARLATIVWAGLVVLANLVLVVSRAVLLGAHNLQWASYGVIILLLVGQTQPWRIKVAQLVLAALLALTVLGLVSVLPTNRIPQ